MTSEEYGEIGYGVEDDKLAKEFWMCWSRVRLLQKCSKEESSSTWALRKWCYKPRYRRLLQTIKAKPNTLYRVAPLSMTLSGGATTFHWGGLWPRALQGESGGWSLAEAEAVCRHCLQNDVDCRNAQNSKISAQFPPPPIFNEEFVSQLELSDILWGV